jgi:DNA-binding CsgD family transcriptional regulator
MRRRPAAALIAFAEQIEDRRLALKLLWLAATELQVLGHGPVVVDIHGARLASELPAQDPTTPGEQALLGYAALVHGDVHRSAALLAQAAEGLRAQCRRTALGEVLALAAWAQLAISAFDAAHASAAEAVWLTTRTREPLWSALAHSALATVAAVRGEEEEAERHVTETERAAVPARAPVVLALAQQARGLAALTAGRPGDAFAALHRTFDPADPAHDREIASVLVGDLAEAASDPHERALVRELAVVDTTSPRVLAAVAHATFVLADDADADAAFAAAYARIGERWPFTRARLLLVHGMRLRRARRMADSRGPLREAAAAFAALGCEPWAERARHELAATVETTSRDERLTPRELEIARLAARGLTNRAIAADLALSPRTVGHHLAKIFPKLDVSSRASVAAALERHGY